MYSQNINIKRSISNTLAILVIVSSISACGFHLRGNIPLPESIQNMFVVGPDGTFKDQLVDILSNVGAQMANSAAGSDVVLNITEAVTQRTVGTLDETGKANSFNLVFNVKYVLISSASKEQIKQGSLQETRRYNFDPELVVETESEEAELQADMEESISLRLVRQLSSLVNHKSE